MSATERFHVITQQVIKPSGNLFFSILFRSHCSSTNQQSKIQFLAFHVICAGLKQHGLEWHAHRNWIWGQITNM